MKLVLCDKTSKAESLLQSDTKMPNLKVIVVIDEVTDTLKYVGNKVGVTVLQFSEMLVCWDCFT